MSQTKAQLIDAVDGSIVTADLADDAVNAAKLASNAVVNASVDASAAIAGSKINPSFTSNVTITNQAPALVLVDSDNDSDFNIQASGGLLNFNDSTNSATRISITSDGKVNFGSVARVEVNGVFKAPHGTAATPAYNFLNDNDNGMFRATTNTIGFSTAGTERMRINSSGHVLPATDSTYNIGADATRFANGYFDTLYGDGSNLTGIVGITINNNSNNRIITATGNANSLNGESALTFDGATLDINGGSNDTPLTIDTTNSSGSHLRFRKDGTDKIFLGCGGGFALGDADDLALRTTDNIIFGVSTSEKMRMTSDGRVGIGTSSPSTLLNLNVDTESNLGSGSEGIRLTSGSSNAQLVRLGSSYSNNSVTGPGTLLFSSNKLSLRCDNGNPMTFHTGSSVAERMRIDASGQLGIGVTPATVLHVRANNGDMLRLDRDNSGPVGNQIAFRHKDGSNNLVETCSINAVASTNAADGNLRFSTKTSGGSNTEKLRITEAGKVGIGTTVPDEKLHVANTSGGASILIETNNSSGGNLLFGDDASNTVGRVQYLHSDNSMRLHTAGSERIRIDSSGRVGIGITNPTSTLHISGDIRTTGRLGVGTAASFANIVSYVTGTGSYPPSGGLVQTDNADSTAMFWNASNSANYTGLSIECRTTGAAYWMIANVYNSSFSGDLAFRTRTGGSSNAERVRFRREGGVTFNGDTAAANALDDYEEGTFAPMTATQAEVYHARYTKIGNKVTINTCFEMKSGQSREHISLPFLPNNDNAGANNNLTSSVNNRYAGTCSFFDNGTAVVNLMLFHQGNQGSSAYFLAQTKDGAQQWTKSVTANEFGKIGVSFTYQTAA